MRAVTRAPATPRPSPRPRSPWPATTNDTCDNAIGRGNTCFDKSRANTASYRDRIGGLVHSDRRGRQRDVGGVGCRAGGLCVGVRGHRRRARVCTFHSMLVVRSGGDRGGAKGKRGQ